MSTCKVNEHGAIYIEKDVVAKIANNAAKECYGLVGMASRNKNGIVELLSFANGTKGISVDIVDGVVYLNLFVIIQYGTDSNSVIAVVSENIIERVKYYIEHQTGLKVGEITINVDGVRVQK